MLVVVPKISDNLLLTTIGGEQNALLDVRCCLRVRIVFPSSSNWGSDMVRTKIFLAMFLGFVVLIIACSAKGPLAFVREVWNGDNLPTWFDPEINTDFATLPLSGDLENIPWSGSAWASNKGGLAARWQISGSDPWNDPLYSLEQLRELGNYGIGRLSPAEKYDIFSNDYSYTFTKAERSRVSSSDPGWYGICHGLAGASLLHAEPRASVVYNEAGIGIPFSSADIKALYTLMHATATPAVANWRYIGVRCNSDSHASSGDAASDACRDANAGAFHVALANEVGIHRRGFIIDRTRGEVIWNRPVFGYSSKVVGEQAPSQGAAAGTVREIVMQTSVFTTKSENARWNASTGPGSIPTGTERYDYRVELDSDGKIIGGEWISWDRPDFAWKTMNTNLDDYMVGSFASMKRLVAALNSAPIAPQPGTGTFPTPYPTAVPTVVPTAVPTVNPTVVPTVSPTAQPGVLNLQTVTLLVEGRYRFDITMRRQRVYLASEIITLEGRILDSLAPSGKVELLNGTQLVASAVTNVSSGKYVLHFQLPAGAYRALDLRFAEYRSGEILSRTTIGLIIWNR